MWGKAKPFHSSEKFFAAFALQHLPFLEAQELKKVSSGVLSFKYGMLRKMPENSVGLRYKELFEDEKWKIQRLYPDFRAHWILNIFALFCIENSQLQIKQL